MTILNNTPGNINVDLPIAEQEMGVDLKIGEDFDLLVNNLQDLSLVAGAENVAQALKLKINTDALGNRFHPGIGVTLPIGEKTTDAVSLKLDIVRTLSVDPRFSNIDVFVQVNGNTYLVDIRVTLAGESVTIPLQFVSGS